MAIDRPPEAASDLASWFAEGVRDELSKLEKESKKEGGERRYEVLSGELVNKLGQNQAIFRFVIADGTLIPEESSGRLKPTEGNEYNASVVSQQGNHIFLQLDGDSPLPPGIPRALLIIDDTALLRELAKVLGEISNNPTLIGPLSTTVFHPDKAELGEAMPLEIASFCPNITGELFHVIKRACGSSITYLWGPPGTGKTYAIAHLIKVLLERGERLLVTSHTNVAVDQAAYEAIKSDNNDKGPLFEHLAVKEGRVLRIGRTINEKVENLQVEKIIEMKENEIQEEISKIHLVIKPLSDKRAICRSGISEWDSLKELESRQQGAIERLKQIEAMLIHAADEINRTRILLEVLHANLEKAHQAWFRRNSKIQKATHELRLAESNLSKLENEFKVNQDKENRAKILADEIKAALNNQGERLKGFPSRKTLENELSTINKELGPLEHNLNELQDKLSRLGDELISNARVIFCTLTKCYIGKELKDQKFDAVIIDEISMALPPLVFLAAGKASSRVILVGDFLQLPPIVRSDSPISNSRLGKDTFHLAGVAVGNRPSDNCRVLTKLSVQRRMVPAIANIARGLVYDQAGLKLIDYYNGKKRESPKFEFLPENPLTIVDTADLNCWSGKQPGSLSRFNFYSATLAVELAAMCALGLPGSKEEPPIGIVTPYAAQRRLLRKLVKDLGLQDWILAGTVHTFQGNQADIIIFDSVLDEPYWGARLCNPQGSEEVKKDLNVAVTRAKHRFIFLGSSEWLNRHAGRRSGLGQLWAFLKDHADLVSANDLVELGFSQRVSDSFARQEGWQLPFEDGNPKIEPLNETNFFERFAEDVNSASTSIFGLVPYFGGYRWPRVQPLFNAALSRQVEVTLITPPLKELESETNKEYVKKAIKNLRDLGAVVVSASGLHGKDIVIDERILYTGSLNWASHRGRTESMHRINSPAYAKLVLDYMQARYIRQSAVFEDGTPRVCPKDGWPIQVVNQRRQGRWDFQSMKVGCTNPDCEGYLRDIDERPPFKELPLCTIDGRTKYRRVRRGRGEVWQCPKHPAECPREKVVPGDP